ncbi:MAG: hypothetical protein ACRDT4_13970 [Micromonosporaceae bacterium]
MRKVIVASFVSLDGCFEGPGNNVMAVREATTNILRHSRAQRCWLIGTPAAGRTAAADRQRRAAAR